MFVNIYPIIIYNTCNHNNLLNAQLYAMHKMGCAQSQKHLNICNQEIFTESLTH